MSTHPIYNPLESPNGQPHFNIDLHDGSDEQVSIIIVHHNKPGYLSILIQSIECMSNLNNYEIIVIDNASTDPMTRDYLDAIESEGIRVIRNEKNAYWSEAANQGAAIADPKSKYFIFMHADTVVLNPSWIDVLVNISASNGSGLVGTQLQSYYVQKNKADFVLEWCMLITRQCWEACGPWPEELPLVGMSFIMTLRAQMRGFNPQTTGNPIVHHYRAFSISANEYEKISDMALSKIQTLMRQTQAS